MKKSLWLWQFSGFVISTFLGTLLHFLFEWTNNSVIVAPFSAVNESTWEHMKLLFFPAFLFAIIERFFLKNDFPCFWMAKFWGVLIGIFCIPILFYTYGGAIGTPSAWINILFFFLSAGIGFFAEYLIFLHPLRAKNSYLIYFILLCAVAGLFMIFTFYPPKLPLFKDPISGAFGI